VSQTGAARWSFGELFAGMQHTFQVIVTEADVDALAAASGDRSPIHMDAEFARSRGLEGRVVHGVLLSSYASRMVGMHLPGENCLLLSLVSKYPQPVYVGDTVQVTGTIEDLSESTQTAVIAVTVRNVSRAYVSAKCKATVLITQAG